MRWFTLTIRAVLWLAILIGTPFLLARYGSPLPDHFPRGEDWRVLVTAPNEQTLADIIVLAAWIAWLILVIIVIRRIITAARDTDQPEAPAPQRWHVPGPMRAITAVLLGGTAAATTAAAFTSPANATIDTLDLERTTGERTDETTTSPPTAPAQRTMAVSGDATYTVKEGDTLWDIAGEHLGDPWRWRDIYDLNANRPQPDGARLTDADTIRPGWKLHLPESENQPGPTTPPPPEPEPESDETREPTPPPTSEKTPPPVSPATPDDIGSSEVPAVDGSPFVEAEDGGFRLPSGAWITAGLATAVTAAIVLARKRHRRNIALDRPSKPVRVRRGVHSIIDAAAEATTTPESDTTEATPPEPGTLPPIVALGGPGADGAVRHLIAEHLTTGDTVLIHTSELERLLDEHTDALDTVPPGLLTVDEVGLALQRQLVARARHTDTAPPTPLLVVTTSSDDTDLLQGFDADAGVRVVVVGTDSGDTTWTITADGHSTTAGAASRRWHHLGALELAGILGTLTDTAPPAPEAVAPPDDQATEDQPRVDEPEADGARAAEAPRQATAPIAATIEVRVLGAPTITIDGEVLSTGLRNKTRELIFYLAEAHPRGSHKDTLTEAVLPDIAMSKAPGHLKTLISNARTILRKATSQPDQEFIVFTNDTYRLDPAVFDCDLWRMNSHLRSAHLAKGEPEEAEHLQAALDTYTGLFIDDLDGDWVDPAREEIRRAATKAATCLAELHQTARNTTVTLTAWQRACELAPTDETIHQSAITACLDAGRSDLALTLFKNLKTALADIDAHPEQGTYGLFN